MCCVFTFIRLEEFSISFFILQRHNYHSVVCCLVSMSGKRKSLTFEDVLSSRFPWSRGCPLQDTHTALTRLGSYSFFFFFQASS